MVELVICYTSPLLFAALPLDVQKVKKASSIQCTRLMPAAIFFPKKSPSLCRRFFSSLLPALLILPRLGLTNHFFSTARPPLRPRQNLFAVLLNSRFRICRGPREYFAPPPDSSRPPTHHHPPPRTSPTKTWQPTASPPVCRSLRPRIVRPLANWTTGASSTPDQSNMSGSSNSNLGKDEVAWYFVEQYYTTLSKSSDKLHVRPIWLVPVPAQP